MLAASDASFVARVGGVLPVWRAFFLAIGTMLVIVGVECLLIDSATLSSDQPEPVPINYSWLQSPQPVAIAPQKTIKPPEWVPWSFIASGAVVILYALTLPRRWGEKKGE